MVGIFLGLLLLGAVLLGSVFSRVHGAGLLVVFGLVGGCGASFSRARVYSLEILFLLVSGGSAPQTPRYACSRLVSRRGSCSSWLRSFFL